MSIPVLATKLYIPPPPPQVVPRPRLIARLNEGLRRKLALIAAPAGFGKTTLLAAWVAESRRPVAWLALDPAESDPTRFLAYLVAAVRTIAPRIGEEVVRALDSPQPPPPESLLTALLNDVATLPEPFTLVLDDYHVLDSPPVDAALTFLIEHLPPQMHLIIATREDPPLPLARLRARGQLTELRAADLRFTPDEAATFLSQVMSLALSAEDVAALETRTEGWIAGLQLAALSMQGREDLPGFVRAFAGDNRYILDYLVEEVLERQPASMRSFLLQTSILDRLNGPLCEAVTGEQHGSARLEALQRGNFFVVPLDDQRQWYRYHHLFAQVLHAHLQAEQPDQIPALHRRAAAWYERNGAASDAIRHALAGEDFERAADLIERALPEMRRSRQEVLMRDWSEALPDDLLRVRPVLNATYASVLLLMGEREGVEARLRDAERWLNPPADAHDPPDVPSAMVVVDTEAFRRLPGSIAVWRAGQALALGDVAGAENYARRALDLVPEDDYLERAGGAGFLALTAWRRGDLDAGLRYYAECLVMLRRVGFLSDALGAVVALADMWTAQGRLREAMRTYERGLQLATEQDPGRTRPVVRGAADMYVGMADLHREHNDLAAAAEHLRRGEALGEHMGGRQNPYRRRVALSRLRVAEGDPDAALALLDEAERLYVSDFFPNVRPIAAEKARVWLRQGRVGAALDWAREQGLSAQDDLSYLREFEHITLARVLLARDKSDSGEKWMQQALGLLERLLAAAEAGAWTGSIIEILVLQALAQQMQGDIPAALVPLQRALALAEPEGYMRIFVDEGPPMAALLQEAARQGIAPRYTDQLLAALGNIPAQDTTPVKQALVEPLSERELQVLRLLGSDLSGPEIARELMVSLNTMNTHTKNIYTKLGVNNRRAAVRRAEELHLL
jgi:ATP/maltotriose-dependent transcriptional regulator MalT